MAVARPTNNFIDALQLFGSRGVQMKMIAYQGTHSSRTHRHRGATDSGPNLKQWHSVGCIFCLAQSYVSYMFLSSEFSYSNEAYGDMYVIFHALAIESILHHC